MPTRLSARKQMVVFVLLGMASACGSSDTGQDSGPGPAGKDGPNRDAAVGPEVRADAAADAVDAWAGPPDATVASEASAELPRLDLGTVAQDVSTVDLAGPDLDGARARLDVGSAPADGGAADGPRGEAATSTVDSTPSGGDAAGDATRDLGGSGNDDTADSAPAEPDAPANAPEAPFDPGPATPIAVNSGNTGVYNLADGTWKVFYFDTEAGQIYVVSGLAGITRGYLDASPSVSPSTYKMATDETSGTLLLTTTTAQRYYLAVGVKGGGASGSFQVADGGKPIPLGTTPSASRPPTRATDTTCTVSPSAPATATH
jgi:hypothetical protein